MFYFLSNIVDAVRDKERADWVVSTWKRDHAAEYDAFVAGIDNMAKGDMTVAFEMYSMMMECLPPEAKRYYDILLQLFCGKQDAIYELTKLTYANEVGECAINGKTLQINISTGHVSVSEVPCKGCLPINVSELSRLWDSLPVYSKAYCKEQFERIKSSVPKPEQTDFSESIIHFLKIHYVSNFVFMPGIMANLYDKAIIENNGLLFAMYYFVTYDHGLQRMARTFSAVITNEIPDVDGVTLFKSTIHHITATSISSGWDSKDSWKDVAENSDNDEAWKEIMHAVRYSTAKHGKTIKQISIDDILKCKNKDKVKACILQFLEENEGQFAMAYLLWCLEKSECTRDVKYMDFHRAMELFLDKQIEAKKPRERYGMLKTLEAHTDKRDEHKRICKNVNQIEQKWVPVFRSTQE